MPSLHAHWFIRSRLKTRHLLLLVALDDERNIHRAAAGLAMTQPAASKLLKEVEGALAVPLFERLPRGVKPTAYGEIMIRHARMTLSHLGDAYDEVEALRAGLTGQVKLGVVAGPGAILVPRAIARMNEQFPRVQIRVDLAVSNVLLPQMQEGRLDILVARLSAQHDSRALSFEPIAAEPIHLLVRRGHPMSRRRKLTLADICECAFVLPPSGDLLRHRFDLLFQQQALKPPRLGVETLALQVLTGLLLQTDMIAVLGEEVARPYVEAGLFVKLPLSFELALDPYGIVTHRNLLLSPSAAVMRDILREEAMALYGAGAARRPRSRVTARAARPSLRMPEAT